MGKPKIAPCCLPFLFLPCTLVEASMAHTCSLSWEKKRQVCLFIFQPNDFLLLKLYFVLFLWGPQTSLEGVNTNSSIHLHLLTNVCLLMLTYVLSHGGITKSFLCRDYKEADMSDKTKNKISYYIQAVCFTVYTAWLHPSHLNLNISWV